MKARIITMVAAAFLALGACKPEVGSIGPSYEAGAGILGTWELTMVEQTDVTLPVPETRDVSDLYVDAQNKWVVAFNSDSTYSVNQQGPWFRRLWQWRNLEIQHTRLSVRTSFDPGLRNGGFAPRQHAKKH
jgi:hypothetical protein